jgi:hypothetical protein
MAIDPKKIKSKVTLKVKNGPGVIIGITEKDVINGEIDFSGLQFDQPGQYTISVIPDSPELEETEFIINVAPEEEIIPQDKETEQEEKKVEGDRPIIAQIDKPSINLPPMKFDITPDSQQNDETTFGLGFTPFFWYNGIQIPERDIRSLELYHEEITPAVTVIFNDTLNVLKGKGYPLDDTKFEIFLNSGSSNLKSIHLRFKLKNLQSNKNGTYTVVGTLDLDNYYLEIYKSYNGTSFEIIRQISKELKLGYNSNIDNTNDSMKWKNTGETPKDFIKSIIDHSYISDNSFMLGYIDHYWCFNYVDIEKEWNRDISNDVGVNSQGVTQLAKNNTDDKKILPLVLTNEPSKSSSIFYISSYKVNNNSTDRSINKGHYMIQKSYDSNTKSFQVFNVDSLTTKGDDNVVLKGAPGDEKTYKENFRTNYSGRADNENIHQNYYYAESQNRVNLDNMTNITCDITLSKPNFNIYKYQKVRIDFINEKRSEPLSDSFLNERISGEWLISDIRYSWKGGSLTQTMVAVRKELTKLKEEKKYDVKESNDNKLDNSEINENPIQNSDGATQSEPSGFIFQDPYDIEDLNPEFVESGFDGLEEEVNENTDEPNADGDSDGDREEIPSNTLTGSPISPTKLYGPNSKGLLQIKGPGGGIAGHRLRNILIDLQDYLRKNGFPGTILKSNGIMRDLPASAATENPKRVPGSLHGAGLAIDLKFEIPGFKWSGIGDNENLAKSTKLSKTIYNWVVSQGDLTWGGQWGAKKGTKPEQGIIKGWGIVEYHHFEIKASKIPQYWRPYTEDLDKLGFKPEKLNTTKELGNLYIKILKSEGLA